MAGKYDHLFVTRQQECGADMVNEGDAGGEVLPDNLSVPWALMRKSDVPDASAYVTTSWIHPKDGEDRTLWVKEHIHDYDEMLMFMGNNPEDPDDLGGEVFMTIEGEEHRLTTTSCVFIPKNTHHCPLGFYGVKHPIRFMAVAMSGTGDYQ